MVRKGATTDQRIAALAARQHGVVSLGQLREAGLRDDAVHKRARAGRLHRVHRGVYAVGHANLSHPGRWLAAVLACGDEAVLSHRSAAALWRLVEPRRGDTHVTVPGRGGRKRQPRIRLHRSSTLTTTDVTSRLGIPVTTPARTIVALRGTATAAEWRRAVRQAEVLGLRTGVDPSAPTRSELEDRFLGLCARHRLPRPEINARVGGWEVDFLWREQRLIVETDGYRFHRGATAFEDDHARDLDLRGRGYGVLRLTYRQVTGDPARVAGLLRRELHVAA
ncbi:MAG: type IV toxin-antitoxin system AbiEi family antitoxin domain-containing protein [Solirubrobacterales bacterium]